MPPSTDLTGPNRAAWDERARLHAADRTGFYRLDRFRAGEDVLYSIEAGELGDIAGKRVLHLQCHIGQDTLCLVRRGAIATGLDFSGEAIAAARTLSRETGLEARFVQGDVADAARLVPGPFDLVFTTWGTIVWLPDVAAWARTIAAVLRPGGELYFADTHPALDMLEEKDGRLVATYDYRTAPDAPLELDAEQTYTGDPTPLVQRRTRQWCHSLSEILGGLIDAGLAPTMLHEHDVLPYRALPSMVPATERLWRLPDGWPKVPLALSLRARKAE